MKISRRAGRCAWYELAAVAGCLAASGGVGAQESAGGEVLEEIVVEGYRGSLRQSLSVKRNATGVVDAIVAEDIADFPDLNLAESIQRIPGVSITRVNGEGRQITVRGLGGDYTRVRINGMEAMSTTGSSDSSGGGNRSRAFDFNTFASDLFNSIVVRKTMQASVEEGAIGATLDLRTARPFDYDEGLTVALSAQGGWNDLSEEVNPRLVGLVSSTNADGTFGGLFSFAYSDRSILEEGFSTVRWQDGTFRTVGGEDCSVSPGPGCAETDTNSLNYHPRIPRYGRLTHEQERLGITGSLQWRPGDDTEVTLEALYSDYQADRDEEYLEVFFRSQEGDIDVLSYTLDAGSNMIDSGTFDISPLDNGTHPVRSEHRYDRLETEFTQLTLGIDHTFTDRLAGNFFVGTATSEDDNPIQTTILADAIEQVDGYVYDFRQGFNTPAVSFGSLDVTDPTQFAFTEVRDRPQFVENTFDTVTGDLEFAMTDTLTLRGGLSWKEFTFDTTEFRRESTFGSLLCENGLYDCDTDNDGTDDIRGAPITGDLLGSVTGFGDGLGMPGGNDTAWISPNVQAAAALIDLYSIPGTPNVGNIRTVEEEDVGAWIQLDFDLTLGTIPVRGDIGVRYVETTTSSTGVVVDENDALTPLTVERSYDDTLPALNVVFELHEDFLIRAAVAEVMARPSLGDLTPGGSLDSFNGPPFGYDAGNPGLDPYRATNFDLSFEWYFAEESLVSLGLFTKDVDSFFLDEGSVIVPYSQSGLPPTLPPASSPLRVALDAGQDPDIELSQTINGGSASLDGFEFVYQQSFSALPSFLANTGFTGNYTHVNSDDILGFSEDAWNATVWYEDERLSARLSAAYRDPYRTVAPNDGGRDERGYDSTMNLDLALAYQLTDSFELLFEAINLTDEYEQQVFDAGDLVNVYHHFGTEYIFGVRWTPY